MKIIDSKQSWWVLSGMFMYVTSIAVALHQYVERDTRYNERKFVDYQLLIGSFEGRALIQKFQDITFHWSFEADCLLSIEYSPFNYACTVNSFLNMDWNGDAASCVITKREGSAHQPIARLALIIRPNSRKCRMRIATKEITIGRNCHTLWENWR